MPLLDRFGPTFQQVRHVRRPHRLPPPPGVVVEQALDPAERGTPVSGGGDRDDDTGTVAHGVTVTAKRTAS
jgi:hypothetical protein